MILVFGISSLMHASSSSSSSIAQGLVRAASIAGHPHYTQLSAGQAMAQANWQLAAAQKMPISASEITEAHLHAIWAIVLSSPNNPSTNGIEFSAQTAVSALSTNNGVVTNENDIKYPFKCENCGNGYTTMSAKSKHINSGDCKKMQSSQLKKSAAEPESSSSSLSSNSNSSGSAQPAQAGVSAMSTNKGTTEHEDYIMRKKYVEDAQKYFKKNEKKGLFICTYSECTKELPSKSGIINHIIAKHLVQEPKFKCENCGNGYNAKVVKEAHSKKRCPYNKIQPSQLKESATEQESSSSSNSSSSGSMQPAKANAIAPTALFTSADNKAQQENEHNPASAQSSSARAIAEAHALAMRASSLSSSSNSSSSGSTHPVQAGVPNISTDNGALAVLPWSTQRVRAKNPQPDPKRLASYNEKAANKKYKEYKKKAEKYCEQYQDSAKPGVKLFKCTYTNCEHTIPHKGQMKEHIMCHHLIQENGLFACLKCARFYYSPISRDKHAHGNSNCESSSSSSNSSSSGSAQASVPDISTNNEASALAASLLPAESGKTQAVGQAQSNGKRKKPLRHKKNSSKKQKVEQKESKEYAQNFPSSSASASVAAAATLLADSASSSSSSSSNYTQAHMPSVDGLSSASAIASTALLVQHLAPPAALLTPQNLAVPLASLASAQAGASTSDNNPISDSIAATPAPAEGTVDDSDIGKFLQSDY